MFRFSPNALSRSEALRNASPNTVATRAHQLGMRHDEPVIVMMDCLMQYATAYEKRFDGKLAEDYVLGPSWLKAASGVREMLNGDGAYAMLHDISTDSKDNGTVEGMFWDAMAVAGFSESDI